MRLRRHKLHIIRFRASTKTHLFRCSSSPQKVFRLFRNPETFISFAVLPKCSSCPGISPQRCFARSVHTRGLGKIISHSAGHSVVYRLSGNKKAGTSTHTDQCNRIDLSLVVLVSHQCNRLLDTVVCKSFTSIKYSCLHLGQ